MKIKFSQVQVNAKFYDTQSGEYWKKVDNELAVLLTGGNHGIMGMVDEFHPDDIVEE